MAVKSSVHEDTRNGRRISIVHVRFGGDRVSAKGHRHLILMCDFHVEYN